MPEHRGSVLALCRRRDRPQLVGRAEAEEAGLPNVAPVRHDERHDHCERSVFPAAREQAQPEVETDVLDPGLAPFRRQEGIARRLRQRRPLAADFVDAAERLERGRHLSASSGPRSSSSRR